MKIAIQGVKASFHDVAARNFWGTSVEPVECATFRKLCEVLKGKKSEFAMMAIENSIAGSILPNYSLLEQFNFKILGEVYLRIEMCFMALPGQKMADLEVVQSHPMALFQCEEFLFKNSHLKAIETNDTAESAKIISHNKLKKHGAIASVLAAETYGLEILEKGIETNKQNYTRFLAIGTEADKNMKANKTTLRFQTPHDPGSLVKILDIFGDFGVNMTKIQSVPIQGKPYEYSFHVDLEFDDRQKYDEAMEKVKKQAINLKNFGEYVKANRIWS